MDGTNRLFLKRRIHESLNSNWNRQDLSQDSLGKCEVEDVREIWTPASPGGLSLSPVVSMALRLG